MRWTTMLAPLQGNIWHILKDVELGVSAAVKMRDACSTINIGNLSHTDFSGGRTHLLSLVEHTPARELSRAPFLCRSLCNAGTLNDNDSGYTLRENTYQGRVGHTSVS